MATTRRPGRWRRRRGRCRASSTSRRSRPTAAGDCVSGDPTAALGDDVTDTGVFASVRDGYDAVYTALPESDTFSRIWRANAYDSDFPEAFAHIGFLTLTEARQVVDLLTLAPG